MKKKKNKLTTIILIILLAISVLGLYIPILFPPQENINYNLEENYKQTTKNSPELLNETTTLKENISITSTSFNATFNKSQNITQDKK